MAERVGSARHRVIGKALRECRERAGMRIEDAAAELSCDVSKVSRIEAGERGIRAEQMRALLKAYDASPVLWGALGTLARVHGNGGWWDGHASTLPAGYLDLAVAEAAASRLLIYAPLRIPELLWTPGYAKLVLAADPGAAEEHQQALTEMAMARSRAIIARRTPVTAIVGHAALWHSVGEWKAVLAQARHMAELSSRCPWIRIRLLPFGIAAYPMAAGCAAFTIAEIASDPHVAIVHVPAPGGGLWPQDQERDYGQAFELLREASLTPGKTIARLRETSG